MTHDELKKTALQKPEVKAAYEVLDSEFESLRQILKTRQEAQHPKRRLMNTQRGSHQLSPTNCQITRKVKQMIATTQKPKERLMHCGQLKFINFCK